MHLHRNLRDRRKQLVGRREERIPFRTFDVHLDHEAPAAVAILADLAFQRVEKMRTLIGGPIADTFVVKHECPTIAGWPRRIKTIVLMHRDVVPARHLASPIVIPANAVRVRCIERLNQIFAHEVSAIIGAAEALQRTIFQGDRLEFRKNRLTEFASRGPARDIANRNGRCCDSDDGENNAYGKSSHEGALHRSRPFKSIVTL